MKTFERIFFALSFLIAFLGMLNISDFITLILLLCSIVVYLSYGYRLLLPIGNEKTTNWIPFIVAYLISQTIGVILFGIFEWPFKKEFSYVTILLLFVSIILLFIYKKKLDPLYPIKDYLIRLIVCFLFAGYPLWK